MEICWQNIEGMSLNSKGNFRKGNIIYIEMYSCEVCGNSYLMRKSTPSNFCGRACSKTGKNNPLFGVTQSKEARLKKSLKLKGIKKSQNVVEKIAVANKGQKRSKESRMRMSIAASNRVVHPWTDRSRSIETRNKISNSLVGRFAGKKNPMFGKRGPLAPGWRGGLVDKLYCPVWRDSSWRSYIYERDKGLFCWNPWCSGNGNMEALHHINYDKKDCRYSNIIKICNSCNSIANFNRQWWYNFYSVLMEKRGLVYGKEN